MKKLFFLSLIFLGIEGYCQSPYVDVATVTADGVTFEVDLIGYTFALANVANVYDNEVNWRYKNGHELETLEEYAGIGAEMVDPNGVKRAFQETFGDEVVKSLRSERYSPMTIFYVIGHDGATWEVAFIMRALPALVSLPPETFAALEKKLKQYVTWKPNRYAQELQFFHMSTFIDFKKVPLSSEMNYPEMPDSVSDKDDRELSLPVLKK